MVGLVKISQWWWLVVVAWLSGGKAFNLLAKISLRKCQGFNSVLCAWSPFPSSLHIHSRTLGSCFSLRQARLLIYFITFVIT